jgi:hypothetical protein
VVLLLQPLTSSLPVLFGIAYVVTNLLSQGWMDDRWRGHTPGLTPWLWFQLNFEKW